MANYKIPAAVTACARTVGYDSAVFEMANWRGFSVYSGNSSQKEDGVPRVGLPFFILYKNGQALPANSLECHAILRDMPDE